MIKTSEREALLTVRNLRTHFYTKRGIVRAVDGVNLNVYRSEVLGVVGESGCGKSATARSIMRLIRPPGRIVNGTVVFDGRAIHEMNESELRRLRGNEIAMIFQQPQSCLNPAYKAGSQIAETLDIHDHSDGTNTWRQALELLEQVRIADPTERAHAYPH